MKKQFIFPAVLYFDEENNNYAVAFHDIDIFTEGETVEEAFKSAKEYLLAYVNCSMHINAEVEDATNYVIVKNEHQTDIVLLVDAEVDAPEGDSNSDDGNLNDIFEE